MPFGFRQLGSTHLNRSDWWRLKEFVCFFTILMCFFADTIYPFELALGFVMPAKCEAVAQLLDCHTFAVLRWWNQRRSEVLSLYEMKW
jgi:hypothetical protein